MTFHTLDTEATWKLISQAINRTDVTLHWPGSDEPALYQSTAKTGLFTCIESGRYRIRWLLAPTLRLVAEKL